MDKETCFGARLARRLKEVSSSTTEDFYYDIDTRLKENKPFIYVLDSMDGLSTQDDDEQFAKSKAAREKGREAGGSYGTAKSKANSAGLRTVVNRLKDSGSILIIICQTRDNIGFGATYNPKTRSGGKALKFYATNEAWFSIKQQIAPKIKGKPRHIGNLVKIQVKKNRQSGWQPTVEVPIYHGTGLDDIGSCALYLIDEGHWKGKEEKFSAPEFDFEGDIEAFVSKVEKEQSRTFLHGVVQEVWDGILSHCQVKRVNRYGESAAQEVDG